MALSTVPVLVGGALIARGLLANAQLAPGDPTRALFVLLPAGLGLVILAVLALAIMANTGQEVAVKSGGCNYRKGRTSLSVRWESLDVGRPRQGMVRSLMLSDGTRFVFLLDAFFPEFDAMLREIDTRATQAGRLKREEVRLG